MFADAVRHHQAGRVNEAERLYRQILQVDSRHVHALHLLGVLAHQVGHNDTAVDLIVKAIALNSQEAAFHSSLGIVLQSQGKLEEAVASYRRGHSLTWGAGADRWRRSLSSTPALLMAKRYSKSAAAPAASPLHYPGLRYSGA